MSNVPARELRNDTAALLRRVEAGEQITITQRGRPVARLVPLAEAERPPMPRARLVELLRTSQADPGLRDLLRRLDDETYE